MKKVKLILAAGIGVALITAGCGDKAAEKVAEKAAEKAIEKSAGGDDVDVDIDSDSGKVKIKGKDGDATFESGGDLPEWVSDDLPIPKGANVMLNTTSKDGNYVQLTVKGNAKDVFEKFQADLVAKGIDIIGEPSIMESGEVGIYSLEIADKNGKLGLTFTSGDGDETAMTITLAPETAGE